MTGNTAPVEETAPVGPAPERRSCICCVMDTAADPLIQFAPNAVCSHCQRHERLLAIRVLRGELGARALADLVRRMKRAGQGREYDCIIGVSGGVDSTYAALLVRQHGLRALAVHLDNGWDSELAVQNIERVVRKLGMDLYTHVIDWDEFRDLQVAFLKAAVPDGEIPTDHAIAAVLWREAARRGVRYIISGMNFTTESISVPDWAYGHSDWRYIKDVHRRFGGGRLTTYPCFSLLRLLWWNAVRRIRVISILNYVEYDKTAAIRTLESELGWRPYGGKHHESVYTRFYQGHFLPAKFRIDKRYGHLSDLINAGQMSRQDALDELSQPAYPLREQLEDLEYVIKKLNLDRAEFDAILQLPRRSFRDYRNNFRIVQLFRNTVNRLRGAGLYPR